MGLGCLGRWLGVLKWLGLVGFWSPWVGFLLTQTGLFLRWELFDLVWTLLRLFYLHGLWLSFCLRDLLRTLLKLNLFWLLDLHRLRDISLNTLLCHTLQLLWSHIGSLFINRHLILTLHWALLIHLLLGAIPETQLIFLSRHLSLPLFLVVLLKVNIVQLSDQRGHLDVFLNSLSYLWLFQGTLFSIRLSIKTFANLLRKIVSIDSIILGNELPLHGIAFIL